MSAARLSAALRRGLRIIVRGCAGGTRVRGTARLATRTVATGSAPCRAGRARLTLRFTASARRSLARKRTVRLALRAGTATAGATLRR